MFPGACCNFQPRHQRAVRDVEFFELLQCIPFVETDHMPRVLLLTRYERLGASSRIRHYDIVPDLEKRGFDFTVHGLLGDDYLRARYGDVAAERLPIIRGYIARLKRSMEQSRYDLVWVEKEIFPWLPWTAENLFYQRSSPPVILDFDDNWPSRYVGNESSLVKAMGARKFARALGAAATVTAASAHLARLLKALFDREIEVVHNGIDVERYALAAMRAEAGRRARLTNRLHVGWIGTPYTASTYLKPIVPLLNRLTLEGLIEVTLIGAGDREPALLANRRAWSEATEADEIAKLDVGLMPISDGTFEQGKSGWKLVQFMAAGRTVIGSDVGFNADIVRDGATGFVARDIAAFEAPLRRLAADRNLVDAMGKNAAADIAGRFSRAGMAGQVAAVFARAISRTR